MNELVSLYLEVVRRPGVAKPYRDRLEFYRRAGQVMEAAAVADVLAEKTRRALAAFPAPVIAVAGGVAANGAIRARLQAVADRAGARFLAPPLKLCTDNAAMIAWAGIERHLAGGVDDATLSVRSRWPLDAAAAPLIGSGKRGAKA